MIWYHRYKIERHSADCTNHFNDGINTILLKYVVVKGVVEAAGYSHVLDFCYNSSNHYDFG